MINESEMKPAADKVLLDAECLLVAVDGFLVEVHVVLEVVLLVEVRGLFDFGHLVLQLLGFALVGQALGVEDLYVVLLDV